MVDAAYSDPELAALYDALNPWGRGDDFFLDLVMAAGSVLDVGCGTGALLHRARQAGHRGQLCGVDPAAPMLAIAAAREPEVDWVRADATRLPFSRAFDLVVMTGHVFQVLAPGREMREAVAAVSSALVDGGQFAFDTRNPLARAWERWGAAPTEVVTADGPAHVERLVREVGDDAIVLDEVFRLPTGVRTSRSRLSFPPGATVSALMADVGLQVEHQYGDWTRTPLTVTSPEVITVARRG